jgi:hypothetical protein
MGDQAEASLSPRLLNRPETDTTVVPQRVARVGHFAGLESIEKLGDVEARACWVFA